MSETPKTIILIAEDNPLMRKMIRSLVEDLACEILECADGEAAINLYEKHLPAWVLMDVSMRPLDGLSATRTIIERFQTARIVIVTDHDDAETRRSAFEAGASDFFGKDFLLPLRDLIKGVSVVSGNAVV
jgi:CheY-like chemotaxis protein